MGQRKFTDWLSLSLAFGGGVAVIVHLVFTPLLPSAEGFAVVAASSAFLWRQSLSAVVAGFVLLGAAEIMFRPVPGAPRWEAPAAALAVLGSAILIAQEWGEIFIVRTLAVEAPETLLRMDKAPGTSMYDLGAMIALGAFTVGILALVAAALSTRGARKAGPSLVLAGLLAVPLLTALSHSMYGGIAGNLVIDAGWILWGIDRFKANRVSPS